MKKFFFLLLLLACVCLHSFAGHIPQDEAENVALNKFYQHTGIHQSELIFEEPIIVSDDEAALYYVFNLQNRKGYVIVAADDRVVPVLGFSDEGNYSDENVPENFSAWMDGYAGQISYAIENDLQSTIEIESLWQQYNCSAGHFRLIKSMKDVSPLLGNIAWDQDAGWNNECPEDASGPGGHCYAGCVATAAGQVMMYWQYPEQGTGSHSYYHPTYGTLSANFGETNYNWAGMSPTSYTGDCPLLLFHLGVAYEMDYGPSGSGASSSWVEYVLPTYFGYKNTLDWVYKSNYSVTDWQNLLIAELEAGRPMTYRGNNSAGENGHAFVCDGVSGNDYFHFNWGWSGAGNGYYYLDNLNPGYDFTYDQAAGIGIEPDISQSYSPPQNLQAVVIDNDVDLSWEAPGVPTQYVYDDNSSEGAWTINPGSVARLGNKFPVTDSGILTSIDLYGVNNVNSGSESVTIDIYDASQNLVGSSGTFVIPGDDWINIDLPDIAFDGTFYVMVKWDNLAGETNYIGFDENGPHANDDLDYYYDGSSWYLLHIAAADDPGVFLIRANAEVSGKGFVMYHEKTDFVKDLSHNRTVNSLQKCPYKPAETPVFNKSKALTGYRVIRDGSNISGLLSPSTFIYTDEDLENDSYTYCIKAVYDDGVSDCSNEEQATVDHTYNAPTDLEAEVIGYDVNLTWIAPDDNSKEITGYRLKRDGVLISGTLPAGTLSYLDEELSPGTYVYCVRAVYNSGLSPCSDDVEAIVTETGVDALHELIKVYPNPVRELLKIDFAESESFRIHIRDISGRSLLTKNGKDSKARIDISEIPKGVYILSVEMTSGIYTDKIVIE